MNSADSLFATARCKTWLTQQDPGSGAASGAATAPGTSMEPCQFASQVDLVFTPEQFNFNRSQYAELTGHLVELLTRESAPDALRVALRARACHFRAPSRWGFAWQFSCTPAARRPNKLRCAGDSGSSAYSRR